jgi:hypothetical protein
MSIVHVVCGVGSFAAWRDSGQGIRCPASLCALLVFVLLLATPGAAMAKNAPPGAPPLSSSQQITDVHQIEASSIITRTTFSGAMWVIERRFTYGEASIVIVVMALCLITVFDIILRLAVQRL